MFERISRGWGIVTASWRILKRYPNLLLLPIFSGIAVLALFGSIVWSVNAASGGEPIQMLFEQLENEVVVYALMFLFYFSCFFIIIFFNAALVFCALDAFAGKQPSALRGIGQATGRLPQIIAWALVATTVGLALHFLQRFLKEKLGFAGALLGGLLEFGWAVMTYFVVPVLVVRGLGPIAAIKESAAILKRTWGESLVGEGGLGIISMLCMLPLFLLIGLVNVVNGWILMGVFAVYFVTISVVFTALGVIFRTGTFLYATTGAAPAGLDAALVEGTFRRKD